LRVEESYRLGADPLRVGHVRSDARLPTEPWKGRAQKGLVAHPASLSRTMRRLRQAKDLIARQAGVELPAVAVDLSPGGSDF
jgi:hypothetical protein